ncbi:hypothetical protein J6590_030437 [Homalodisca vitripennis]|nr:hypothetical protein J6590_030437 [Homalodisca vitripennis]
MFNLLYPMPSPFDRLLGDNEPGQNGVTIGGEGSSAGAGYSITDAPTFNFSWHRLEGRQCGPELDDSDGTDFPTEWNIEVALDLAYMSNLIAIQFGAVLTGFGRLLQLSGELLQRSCDNDGTTATDVVEFIVNCLFN